ncbi:MAG: DUF58 domain-containing protein [Planctomycetaceae bacterium]
MSVRPASTAIAWVGFSVALAITAFVWRPMGIAAIVVLAALVPGMVVEILILRKTKPLIDVQRNIPTTAGRATPFRVLLEITSRASRPIHAAVRDILPEDAIPSLWTKSVILPANDRFQSHYSVRIPHRGLHAFGPVWIRIRGRWGLAELQFSLDSRAEVKVFPEVFHEAAILNKESAAEVRLLDQRSRTRQQGIGTEFQSLDEFRTNDDPRHIDWRATARQNRLIIRRFQTEKHRDVVILVDCGRLMGAGAGSRSKLDCAVDSALMLARVVLHGGDHCGVGMFDDEVIGYLPPTSGPNALATLTGCLYNLQTRWRESDFASMFATLQTRQRKRCLVIVISDLIDPETSVRLRQALLKLVRQHVVLFAALRTPELSEAFRMPLTTDHEAFQNVVAARIIKQRESALHMLGRSSVQVVDVEPSQLTVPLIDRFLELRERSQL